jgi:hypothetical protein
MTTYQESLTNKKYIPNVVILFKGHYWAIRQPDSGLTVDADRLCLEQVAINPTKVDPAKANTTINTYNFTLIDKNYKVTLLFDGITRFFQNEPVEIFIGRCGVDMSFDDYMPLPITYVKSVSKDGLSYKFNSAEARDRLNRPAFNVRNKLEVDILAETTEIDAQETLDPDLYPASGLIKLNDEFISYESLDLVNNRFSGCVRGEENSTPAAHEGGDEIFLVTEVQGNPVDLILQFLISSGGGGSYDVLPDGAGIDESLVDIESFEEVRDEFFLDQDYRFLVFGVENILDYLEREILFANELRIVSNSTAKLALTVLNRRIFDVDFPVINNDSIKKQPGYEVSDSDVFNVVRIEYGYNYVTEKYLGLVTLTDEDSITDFGRRELTTIKLKGISNDSDGLTIATNIAQRFLTRFSYPKPEISINTHMDKSLISLGEKIQLYSTQIPNPNTGDLNFVDTLEVLERGINWKTGDVKFKLGYTSFTGIKECYMAPSDSIVSFTTQKSLTIGAGRGELYRPGWKLRLYSNVSRDYVSSQVNEIDTIVGDVVTFKDDWADALSTNFRVMFADFDDVTEQQRRYCFISNAGLPFSNGDLTYEVTI